MSKSFLEFKIFITLLFLKLINNFKNLQLKFLIINHSFYYSKQVYMPNHIFLILCKPILDNSLKRFTLIKYLNCSFIFK